MFGVWGGDGELIRVRSRCDGRIQLAGGAVNRTATNGVSTVMLHSRVSSDEISRRGRALYEDHIRSEVEPAHNGKLVAIDVKTGAYEADEDEVAAVDRALAKHPDAALYIVRAGARTAHRLGGRFGTAR